jgi:hypothetical protein
MLATQKAITYLALQQFAEKYNFNTRYYVDNFASFEPDLICVLAGLGKFTYEEENYFIDSVKIGSSKDECVKFAHSRLIKQEFQNLQFDETLTQKLHEPSMESLLALRHLAVLNLNKYGRVSISLKPTPWNKKASWVR